MNLSTLVVCTCYTAVGVCITDYGDKFYGNKFEVEFAFGLCVIVYKKKNKQFEKLSTKPTVQWVISLPFFFFF